MSSSEPGSPSSPSSTSSQDSLGDKMSELSISSTPLTAKSKEVNWFTVLFSQSTPEEKDFYVDEFFKYMPRHNLLRKGHIQTDKKNADNCIKNFLIEPTNKEACTGFGPIDMHRPFLNTAYREFLKNFKFPPTSTMSLPQLELLSMLIFSKREPEALSSCKFVVQSVMFGTDNVTKYATYSSSEDKLDYKEVEQPVQVTKTTDELLDFLKSIGITNNVITKNFNLGKMSKPTDIPIDIQANRELTFDKTYFVFDFVNPKGNKSIITMRLGKTTRLGETTSTVTDCKFVVYNIKEHGVVETYSWDGTIDDMKFYHECEGGPKLSAEITGNVDDADGGAGKRRYSKSTNKTKRAKRARRTKRRNIKKNKSRRKYGKARNTKRKLRRFHH
jgi:hypothetical protein